MMDEVDDAILGFHIFIVALLFLAALILALCGFASLVRLVKMRETETDMWFEVMLSSKERVLPKISIFHLSRGKTQRYQYFIYLGGKHNFAKVRQ